MRVNPLAVLVLCVLTASSALAVAPTTSEEAAMLQRIYDEALTHGQAYDNLKTLVGTYPYRLSGTETLNGAIAWGTSTLKALEVDRVWSVPCMVPHWVRGQAESVSIVGAAGESGTLTATALGGSAATPDGGLTAEVIELHSLKELAQLGRAKLQGKVVFFNRPMDPTLINTGRAYGLAGDQRNHGPGAASRYGVVAVLTRSLTETPDDIPHTGTTSFGDNEQRIPAAALSIVASNKLSAAIAKDPHTQVTIAIHAQMLPDVPSSDTIGEIRGSEFPDQIIEVGGHMDSWDIAPGAHDDGAGVVQSIEVLRLFKALDIKPRHTIRCILFVNEENGSRGSAAYATYVKGSPERHLLAMETDNGGFQPRGFHIGNIAHDAGTKAARWKPLFEPYAIADISEGSGGADVTPLLVLGIPVGQLIPDSQRYFDYHHTKIDTIDKVNARELHLGAATLASLIWLVDQEGL